jgi:very-short-patch-repair endonuclease
MCDKLDFELNNKTYEVRIIKENDIILYNVADIGKLLKISNIRSTSQYINKNEKIMKKSSTKGGQSMLYLTELGFKILLSKCRSSFASDVAKFFNMTILDIYSHSFESSTIKNIIIVFKNENIKCQYFIDNYRIDLYFIDYKLALECDETYHKNNKVKDEQRQKYIEEKLDCKFIRYNPQENEFNIFTVINQIYEHIKYCIQVDNIIIHSEKLKV